jgi:hypothetical protein
MVLKYSPPYTEAEEDEFYRRVGGSLAGRATVWTNESSKTAD